MLKLIPLFCGLFGILSALIFYSWVTRVNGHKKADYQSISESNLLFHRDEWLTIIIMIIVLSVVTGVFVGWFCCGIYIYGALVALFVEYAGTGSIVKGRVELTLAQDNTKVFRIAYRSGIAAGLFMVSFGLLTIGAVFIPFKLHTAIKAIACYAFGTSTVVLLNRTRFKPISDMYESFVATLISGILLSTFAVNSSGLTATFNNRTAAMFPLIIVGVGIVASVIGAIFVRGRERSWKGIHINICVIVSGLILSGASVFLSIKMLQSYVYAVALIVGLVVGVLIGICSARKMTIIPILLFIVGMIVPYVFVGLYGIALSAIGFASITAILISINSFGLVTDENSAIVNLGNGYSTCVSALTVLTLFVAFTDISGISNISIIAPKVLSGLLVGVAMPLIYTTLLSRNTEDKDYTFITDLVAIIIPIVIGVFLGIETLGALLGGLVTSGLVASFMVNNRGLEMGTDRYHIAVSSINVLIKNMTIIALVFAPVFGQLGSIIGG